MYFASDGYFTEAGNRESDPLSMALRSMAEAMATTNGYIIRGGVRAVVNPLLRSFVLGDERQCRDMVLVLVRVVPLAQGSYMTTASACVCQASTKTAT